MSLHRTLDGADHLVERREMNDGLNPVHNLPAERTVSYIPFDQLHITAHGLKILPLPREEVVQHPDALSSLQQRLDHVRADKACSTCHQIGCHLLTAR